MWLPYVSGLCDAQAGTCHFRSLRRLQQISARAAEPGVGVVAGVALTASQRRVHRRRLQQRQDYDHHNSLRRNKMPLHAVSHVHVNAIACGTTRAKRKVVFFETSRVGERLLVVEFHALTSCTCVLQNRAMHCEILHKWFDKTTTCTSNDRLTTT